MKLLALLNETFPGNRADGGVFVWTRRGDLFTGRVKLCDEQGMVLETEHGTVLLLTRSIVAISDRREALRPEPPSV